MADRKPGLATSLFLTLILAASLLKERPCDCGPPPTPNPPVERAPVFETGLALAQPRFCQHDPENQSEAFDDRQIMLQLDRQATELIQQEAFTPIETLRAQLESEPRGTWELPTPQRVTMSPSELFASRADSVLIVGHVYDCGRCDGWHVGPSTGVVLSPRGIGATNYHVLASDNAKTLVAGTRNGNLYPIREVIAASKSDDLAVFRFEAEGLTAAPLRGDSPVGTPAWVISHPSRRFFSFTDGMVSRYHQTRRDGQLVPTLTITADYARGSSGGPVFDDAGNLIGLVSRTESLYYSVEGGIQRNLQMVFKQCVPSRSLLNRLDPPR